MTRRRGVAVEHGVLEATLALLTERGEFSVEDVAERAGVHKTTVYRRWTTRPALVAAALQLLADRDVAVVDSGDLRGDLEQLAVQVARALRSSAGTHALRAALATAGADSGLRAAAGAFLAARYRLAAELIEAGQADGRVRADLDPVLAWQAVVNPLHLNALTGGPLDDGTARALLAVVWEGVAAGVQR